MKIVFLIWTWLVKGEDELGEEETGDETGCNGCNQDYTKVHINATNGEWTGCHKMCTCRQELVFTLFDILGRARIWG